MHFVFNCICAALFCLTISSLTARSLAASYASRAAVFRRTTSSHSTALFSSHSPPLSSSSSRIFLFSFSSLNSVLFVPLFPFTLLLIFSYSGFPLCVVIQCSFVYKLMFFLPKKYYISFRKK